MGYSVYRPKRRRHVAPEAMVFAAAASVANGRSGSTLTKQMREGRLVRVGQGIYARPDAARARWIDALVVAAKAPEAVFSGATALHLQDLLGWAPPAVFVSQLRGTAVPTAPFVPVRVRWVDQDDLMADVLTLECDGARLHMASPGRAVAEMFADRHGVGLAMCSASVLDLCAAGVLDIRQTLKHAHRLRCATDLRALLGALCG